MTPIDHCLEAREPPLPWLAELAARLAAEDPTAMESDPGVISRSLSNAVDLFGLPAVAVSLQAGVAVEAMDATAEVGTPAEAFAVDVDAVTTGGNVPTLLEATERLAATLDDSSVLGAVPGPATLVSQLLEAGVDDPETIEEAEFTASEAATELADAYLDRGADGLVVLEPMGLATQGPYAESIAPLRNVIDHYGGVLIVATEALDVGAVRRAGEAGIDGVMGEVENIEAAIDAAEDTGIVLGVGIPDDRFRNGTAAEFAEGLPPGVLASSCGGVPAETDPSTLHALMGSL